MTDLVITQVGDTWANGQVSPDRRDTNYGNVSGIVIKDAERYGFLLPELPSSLIGATIVDAYLVGHSAEAFVAQTITVRLADERWSPGRLTWNHKPGVLASTASTVISGTSGAGETVTLTGLGPLLQQIADGTDWYGFRLTTNTATAQRFYSTESGQPAWELHITVSDVPDAPSNLRPDGGTAVGDSTPIYAWEVFDFGDVETAGQAELQVQVDTPTGGADPDEVTPDYDSGWTLGTDPQFDPTGLHAVTGAGPHYWRVRVEDGDGNQSAWSDWAEFTVSARHVQVIDSPTGAFGDPTPILSAHITGETLTRWDIIVTGADRSDVRLRSGLQTGAVSLEVPLRNSQGRRVLRDDEIGYWRLRTWGDVERAVAVGEPPYVESWNALEFDDDLGVTAPTALSVTQVADGDPRQEWEWSRASAPDAWLVQVDGRTVARLEAEDVSVNAGVYTWTDSGEVSPLRPHTLSVRAIVSGERSAAATVSGQSHTVKGVWLLPDDSDPIQLSGTAVAGFAHTDRRARYEPLVGPPVDIIYDPSPGRVGRFAGSVDSRQDVWAAVDAIEALRAGNREGRMVWGSQSIRVRLVDPDATSADDILPSNLLHDVSFEFVQLDD